MKTLIALSLLASTSALAALPPGAESLRRFAAIAQSPAVFEKIGRGDVVKSITDNGNGNYLVVGSNCALNVKITVKSNGMIGPGQLVVTPGEVNCLPR